MAAPKESDNSRIARLKKRHQDENDDLLAKHKGEQAALRRQHDDEDAKDPERRHRHQPEARSRERAKEQSELRAKQRKEYESQRDHHRSELLDAQTGNAGTAEHRDNARTPESAFDDTRRTFSAANAMRGDKNDRENRAGSKRHQREHAELDEQQQQVRHASSRYDHPRTQSALHAHQVHQHQKLVDRHDQELASDRARQNREGQSSDEMKRRHERQRRELEDRQRHERSHRA